MSKTFEDYLSEMVASAAERIENSWGRADLSAAEDAEADGIRSVLLFTEGWVSSLDARAADIAWAAAGRAALSVQHAGAAARDQRIAKNEAATQ